MACRHPQGAVAVAVRQLVDREVLLPREYAAWNLAADHELVSRLAVRAPPLPALVAILLLVRPVELEELGARLGEGARVGGELGGDVAA